ncbi:MAG: addiction module toxin RelE [Burkholderia sp.]|jgi:mRNA interferase RelE/StbE|nr:addiction module toxin RelE [Burkholderia sp.]
MTYELRFHTDARKEWDRLDSTIREQFKKKLRERLENPCVDAARVSGGCDLYKIKLRTIGYRLVYQVHNEMVLVLVLSVGKRERNFVYKTGLGRI